MAMSATTSGHIGKLMAAELLVCEQRGRHRYYRLADDEVAHAREAVALIAERRTHTVGWANPTRQRLRFARCCYGHLAGLVLQAKYAFQAVDSAGAASLFIAINCRRWREQLVAEQQTIMAA